MDGMLFLSPGRRLSSTLVSLLKRGSNDSSVSADVFYSRNLAVSFYDIIHYTVLIHFIHYTLYTIHLYTIQYTVYTIQYTVYTIHYTVYTVQSIQYEVLYVFVGFVTYSLCFIISYSYQNNTVSVFKGISKLSGSLFRRTVLFCKKIIAKHAILK